MRNSSNQPLNTNILLWPLVITAIHCYPNMDGKFVADIVPMDIFIAPKNSKQVRDELKEKSDIEMTLSITEITEPINYRKSSNLTIFGNDSFEIKNPDNIITFYDSRRATHHADDISITILIAISGTAIMTAFGIAIASALYRHRRRFCTSSKVYRQAKSSFFAPETESHTWDSLSFSCAVADFSTSKIQFRSLESLSDDSYINSLDEAISYKASIVHNKSLKNVLPKSITNTTISELSVSDGPLK